MAEEWLTYSELGERLGVSAEAARQKAIRLRLRRQTANDGKAQVLVDVEDVRASSTPRKPKDQVADDRLTADEQPADERALAALEAHITTLKEMVAKAEAISERERERADGERDRADSERARADIERDRANELVARVEELLAERAKRAEAESQVESQVAELKVMVEQMRRPWWKRLVG
jgi:hypothetical protein